MKGPKLVSKKSEKEIAIEWDDIAVDRAHQILEEKDMSYKHILAPAIFSLISQKMMKNIIDVGCGIGHLTQQLLQYGEKVTGVDLSKINIEMANSMYTRENLSFFHTSIEGYAQKNKLKKYELAVANMTLMDAPSLDNVVEAVSKLLVENGQFIFSITHPCFWPFYWDYGNKNWFEYNKELFIESQFQISLDSNVDKKTTHIHRPISYYINSLSRHGFQIQKILEPMPSAETSELYPVKWIYPRFMVFQCKLN